MKEKEFVTVAFDWELAKRIIEQEIPGIFRQKSGQQMCCCGVHEDEKYALFCMDGVGYSLQYMYNLKGQSITFPVKSADLVIEIPFVYVMKEGDVAVGRGENDTIICIVKSVENQPDGKLQIRTHASFNMDKGTLTFDSSDFKDVKTITPASDIETYVLFDQLVRSNALEANVILQKFFDVNIPTSPLASQQDSDEKDEQGSQSGFWFGGAIEALNFGGVLRRLGWDNRSLVVFKQIPADIGENVVPKMTSLPQNAKDIILESQKRISYNNQCILYNLHTGEATSWIPTMEDIFSKDWVRVQP
jgi:hypothetical protein